MKGVLSWLVCRASTRDFLSALAALVSQVQNIVFLAVHYLNSFFPIAQQAGQAVVLGRLSLSMCLCKRWLYRHECCTGVKSMRKSPFCHSEGPFPPSSLQYSFVFVLTGFSTEVL